MFNQISNSLPTKSKLEESNEKTQNQDATKKALKRFCRVCKEEVEPIKLCKCLGKGGGGGDSGEGSGVDCALETPAYSLEVIDLIPQLDKDIVDPNNETLLVAENIPVTSKENDKDFDISVIAKLLAEEILLILNDKENGILTIKCNPKFKFKLSPEETLELNKFINFIENQFNEFKNQFPNANCAITIAPDLHGNNSMVIQIASPTLYEKFINQLTNSIYLLSPDKNRQAVNLIATLLQDDQTIPQDKKDGVKKKYLDFIAEDKIHTNPSRASFYETPTLKRK